MDVLEPGAEALSKDELAAKFVRSANNYDTDLVSEATGLYCEDPSLADQSQCEECDINTIVRRFGLSGHMPQVRKLPEYGDYTGIDDFKSALEAVQAARDDFMSYPAALRYRFNNDPQEFLEFCCDARNLPEMRKLGLAVPEVLQGGTTPEASPAASGASA